MVRGSVLVGFAMLWTLAAWVVRAGEREPHTTVWDYPFRPGSPGWEEVTDLYGALQIPKEIYTAMPTGVLADSCLDFPFKVDVLALSNPEQSFRYQVSRFEALQALLKRSDVATVLLERYETFDLNVMLTATGVHRFSFVSFLFFSQMIMHEEVLEKLTPREAERLAAVAIGMMRTIHANEPRSSSLWSVSTLTAKVVVKKRLGRPWYPPGIPRGDLERFAQGKPVPNKDMVMAITLAFAPKPVK